MKIVIFVRMYYLKNLTVKQTIPKIHQYQDQHAIRTNISMRMYLKVLFHLKTMKTTILKCDEFIECL